MLDGYNNLNDQELSTREAIDNILTVLNESCSKPDLIIAAKGCLRTQISLFNYQKEALEALSSIKALDSYNRLDSSIPGEKFNAHIRIIEKNKAAASEVEEWLYDEIAEAVNKRSEFLRNIQNSGSLPG